MIVFTFGLAPSKTVAFLHIDRHEVSFPFYWKSTSHIPPQGLLLLPLRRVFVAFGWMRIYCYDTHSFLLPLVFSCKTLTLISWVCGSFFFNTFRLHDPHDLSFPPTISTQHRRFSRVIFARTGIQSSVALSHTTSLVWTIGGVSLPILKDWSLMERV